MFSRKKDTAPPADDDAEVVKALVAMVNGATFLKAGRSGKPHFRHFELTPDLSRVAWTSPRKASHDASVRLADVRLLIRGAQSTRVFQSNPIPEFVDLSFSLVVPPPGGAATDPSCRTLDVVCKDKREFDIWMCGLRALVDGGARSVTASDPGRLASLAEQVAATLTSDGPDGAFGAGGPAGRARAPHGAAGVTMVIDAQGRERLEVSSAASDLYTWGIATGGRLGHGGIASPVATGRTGNSDPLVELTPRVVEALLGRDVTAVAASRDCSFAIADGGDVFAWGAGIRRLRPNEIVGRDLWSPLAVARLAGYYVSQVAASDRFAAALSPTSGRLYVWGAVWLDLSTVVAAGSGAVAAAAAGTDDDDDADLDEEFADSVNEAICSAAKPVAEGGQPAAAMSPAATTADDGDGDSDGDGEDDGADFGDLSEGDSSSSDDEVLIGHSVISTPAPPRPAATGAAPDSRRTRVYLTPRAIPQDLFGGRAIRSIVGGPRICAAIDSERDLWLFGHGAAAFVRAGLAVFSADGQRVTAYNGRPVRVDLPGHLISPPWAGEADDAHGQLHGGGSGGSPSTEHQRVRVHQVSIGAGHVAAICSGEDVLSLEARFLVMWGDNSSGQCAIDPTMLPYLSQPRAYHTQDYVPVEVACGHYHTLLRPLPGASAHSPVLFSCGAGAAGQLGLGFDIRPDYVASFQPVTFPAAWLPAAAGGVNAVTASLQSPAPTVAALRCISAGERQSAAVTDAGQLFFWGTHLPPTHGLNAMMTSHQLALTCAPQLVESTADKMVRYVKCGAKHTLAGVAHGWVPDHEAKECMACKKRFTQIRRRHHCRKCGGVFCGSCSSKKFPLLDRGFSEPVRVCDKCYGMLSRG